MPTTQAAKGGDKLGDLKERLIEAGERLFAEHGAQHVSMRMLASDVGVSPMAAYRHFKDRDEILATLRARSFDRFAAALEQAGALHSEPQARARAVGEAYLRFAFDHHRAYRLMFDFSQSSTVDYPELSRANARAAVAMSDYMRALVAAGLVEGDPDVMAHVYWGALHGVIALKLSGKMGEHVSFDALQHELFRVLRRGAAPEAAGPVRT